MTRKEQDAYRRGIVRQYRESGMTRKEFCAANDVALSSLDLWKRRYPDESDAVGYAPLSVVSVGSVRPTQAGRKLHVSSERGVSAELDLPATEYEIAALVRAIASL